MTAVSGVCAHCGTTAKVAELSVYTRAPGTVVRCRNCAGVVMVLVEIRGTVEVYCERFELLGG